MSTATRTILALIILAASTPALAQEDAESAEPVELAPEKDEAAGECKSPRQAWLQLLYWGNRGNYRAAGKCFDTSKMERPKEIALIAEELKEYLDGEGWKIDTVGAPTVAGYLDPSTKTASYRDPSVEDDAIYLAKVGDRWVFGQETIERVYELRPFTKRLADHLPAWFHGDFIGVEIWKYFGVVLLFFIALLIQKSTVFFIRHYLKRIVDKMGMDSLEHGLEIAGRPIGGLSMAAVFYVGFPLLRFPLAVSTVALIATKALAAYSLVWLGYRLIDILGDWLKSKASATDTKLDDQLVPLITKTLKVFVAVVGGIFVLQNLNVDVGSLLAGVGLGGLAFALAAKDTVANFFGSVMIFIDKPFQIGDWVDVDGVEGTVEEVGFRTTRVRTFYNSLITLPNANIVSKAVDNFGARQYRRYTTSLGLTYDTPPDKVQAFCEAVRALIAGMPGMRKDYYLVEFKDFGPSSLEIMLYCFMVASTWNDELRTRTNLNLEIMRIARDLGVSFAFPTQTLHVETLAESGQSRPSHSGPGQPNELKAIIEGYGPDGERRTPRGVELSEGFDCGPRWESKS